MLKSFMYLTVYIMENFYIISCSYKISFGNLFYNMKTKIMSKRTHIRHYEPHCAYLVTTSFKAQNAYH